MSANRYQPDPVTGGLRGTNNVGTVVERIQPNHATGGFDRYVGGQLREQIIPDNLGGFSIYENGKLINRK